MLLRGGEALPFFPEKGLRVFLCCEKSPGVDVFIDFWMVKLCPS